MFMMMMMMCNTHLFYPIAIETAGTWHNMAH